LAKCGILGVERPNKEEGEQLVKYMIREMVANAKVTDQVLLEALNSAIPAETIQWVVAQHGLCRERQRKLSMEMGVALIIAMNLFWQVCLAEVLTKLLAGFRYLWAADTEPTPASKGAISQLRYALGAQVLVDLFHAVCKPMTTPQTPGAFAFGLRLMGIDGTEEALPDTAANARAFGRHTSGRGPAGFPQLKAVYLVELGSHAIVEAGFWPVHTGERVGGKRVLRAVGPGMLVLWDCGFHSFELVRYTLQVRKAHILTRLPAGVKVQFVRRLADSSWLIDLVTRDPNGKVVGEPLRLRLIEYTITDPALPGYGEKHRLITSLLDPEAYPALALVQLYHQRWEVEITIDETDTHQREAFAPLRSKKPVGVIQELYGLLLAHYVIRKVMLDAAQFAHIDPDGLSFSHALQVVTEAIFEFQITHPDDHPRLYQRLLQEVARVRLPPRKLRSNPRVVKRKMSNFDKKGPQHRNWPQPTLPFARAIALI